jgi:hypothetical protein
MSERAVLERTRTAVEVQTSTEVLRPREVTVFTDANEAQSVYALPDELPSWAMSLSDHTGSIQRTATYRCTSCSGEHEQYNQNPRLLPYAKVCGCVIESSDSTSAETCTAPALRRTTYPGEGVALNARRFEQLSVFEVHDWDHKSDDFKRSHQRYYVPGRNYEPVEPGYVRHDLTNIQDYNRFVKTVSSHELQKMRDHRAMHEEYWRARRKSMRDDVNARIRHSPLLMSIARMVRARSDRKSDARYGRALDPHFHAQLLEFNQSSMQAFCDADTGWKDRRAR